MLCGHYYLEPVPCERYDPESKGMVEAKVGYVKRNALQGRDDELENWDGYERLATDWRDSVANVRLHDRLGQRPIDRFAEEQQHLRPLPAIALDTDEIVMTEVRPTTRIDFDGNRYSVPPHLAQARRGPRRYQASANLLSRPVGCLPSALILSPRTGD